MTIISSGPLAKASGAFAMHNEKGIKSSDTLGLPENIDLASLMAWLGTRMRDSDADIRSRMGDMNSRKQIQNQLSALTEAFRQSMKGADQGDGKVAVAPPLDNPQAIRESDWFNALDATTRNQVESLLNMVQPGGYIASNDVTIEHPDGTKYEWKKGERISDEALAKHSLLKDNVHKVPAQIKKDDIERAVQTLGDVAKTAASNDEIEMIELQSAISARGQLLQLVSNMIGSFHDSAKSIVGNIRG